MLHKSTRYIDTLWCICNNYDEYLNFAKELYQWKEITGDFGGNQFDYEDNWFDTIGQWMDVFGVPYVKEYPDDEYSWENEIEDPLTSQYEITEKPNEDEYPVIVHVHKYTNEVQVDWYSIKTLLRRQ